MPCRVEGRGRQGKILQDCARSGKSFLVSLRGRSSVGDGSPARDDGPLLTAKEEFHGANAYVHFTANRVSRTCGGFAGAMLANCVPTL